MLRTRALPQADIAKQRDLFAGQLEEEAKATGKSRPPEAIQKILDGKIDKWCSEVCLNEQELITRDDKKTVGAMADELTARIGEKIGVRRFVRFELGEGVEKKVVDFAAEVAEQLKG